MERTPVKNEFACTSIPRYSFYDSGFCGSEIKPYPSNPFYSLSPMKESPSGFKEDAVPFSRGFYTFTSPLKRNNSTYDSNQNLIRIGKSDIAKQLSFKDSLINESYNQPAKHSRYCPKKDSDNGKSDTSYTLPYHNNSPRVNPTVNFLTRLKKKNCETITSDLFPLSSAEDLCRMSCVDKMSRELIMADVKANGQRREYLKSIKAHRENRSKSGISPFDLKKMYGRIPLVSKFVHSDITDHVEESEVSTKGSDPRFDSILGGPK